jgi:hypothetical protein
MNEVLLEVILLVFAIVRDHDEYTRKDEYVRIQEEDEEEDEKDVIIQEEDENDVRI